MGDVEVYGKSWDVKGSLIYAGNDGDLTIKRSVNSIVCPFSNEKYDGMISRLIKERAQDIYFPFLERGSPLKNLQTMVLEDRGLPHMCKFHRVIFIKDELKTPVESVVYASLVAGQNSDSISLPLFRSGSHRGVYEKSNEELAFGIAVGLDDFLKSGYNIPREINFISKKEDSLLVDLLLQEFHYLFDTTKHI